MTSNNSIHRKDQLISSMLGEYQPAVDAALMEMLSERIIDRIWAHDHTVWKPDPNEISNRLGWLDIAERMQDAIPKLVTLAESLRWEGYQQAVLLGMGGSSLAPEVLYKTFGQREGFLDLAILDSTDPGAVLSLEKHLDLAHTLFIVSTKSGTTTETLSFFKYFYNRVVEKLGSDHAGDHFIAITDLDSQMVELASTHKFRSIFANDPNIGGRYSALSYFGLVPAVLAGVDVARLLKSAIDMAGECKSADNPGGYLGVILGELAKAGRDKVTFILSPKISSFGDWVEQLIAESTGKSGKGILPVVGEPTGPVTVYGSDRLFVSMQLDGDDSLDAILKTLSDAGHPVLSLHLQDRYEMGEQFFLWELATAVAGYRLGIQPFDQPNVEAAKILARKIIVEFTQNGALPELKPADLSPAVVRSFLDQATPGAYIAIQAYVNPGAAMDLALLELRCNLREYSHLATTVGYGPRFLHSTGQLHKGDAGKGMFVQLTSRIVEDVNIPDKAGKPGSSISFGTLKTAQVLGDQQALLKAGRKVIHFDLGASSKDEVEQLNEIIKSLK
jgi:transaldolase/glucose-6-phosphate isomerase